MPPRPRPLPPGSTIGILGSGQLGRMLALAAAQLGFKCHVFSDVPGPAFDVAAARTLGAYENVEALTAFARSVDAATYEFENIPVSAVAEISQVTPVYPDAKALAVSQDRLTEKQFLAGAGLPVAPFAAVESVADVRTALETLGAPAILKTRRSGYDGKGQVRLSAASGAESAFSLLRGAPAILEKELSFACEISVIALRTETGEVRFYDCPANTHENGILRTSRVPAPLAPEVLSLAVSYAEQIVAELAYVGILAVEMFYREGEGAGSSLVINEIAPRVHNSGHWTLDACPVSQFENHIRAVAGWPAGSVHRHSDALMENLIGGEVRAFEALAADPCACLHLYGKDEARPGRKMGHVTRLIPRTASQKAAEEREIPGVSAGSLS